MMVVSCKLERIPAAKSTNIKIIDVKADLKNVLVDWLDGWDHGKASDKITDRQAKAWQKPYLKLITILFKLNGK